MIKTTQGGDDILNSSQYGSIETKEPTKKYFINDDTTFATNAELSAEISSRQNEDTTLQGEINTILAQYIGGNNNYGSTLITNLNTITKDGFYTITSAGTGVPNASYNWFIIHQNSSSGTVFATQRAVAFDSQVVVFERTKTNSVWNAWQPANAPTEALVPQIRFNGTLTGNIISGTLDSSVSTYSFTNQGLVNVYLVLPLTTLTGVLNSNYVIRLYDKDNNLIVINNINHSSAITSATVGDMCQLQNYDVNTGYEWQFTARYSQFDNGGTTARVLYTTDVVRESVISLTGGELYSHIVNNTLRPNTYVLVSESYTNSGTTYTEGVKYKIEGTWTAGELFTDAVQESDPTREDISHKKSTPDIASPSATDYLSELGTSKMIEEQGAGLVAEVELTTAASSITINNLDLNADGRVYDVIVIGSGTENDLFLQVNNTTSNYAYALLGSDNLTTRNPLNSLFTGQSHFKVSVGFPSLLISKFTISTDTNNISISGTGCGIRSSVVPLLNYTISYNGILPAVSNITSLIFSMSSGGTLYTGTKVKIYKRASNVATRS